MKADSVADVSSGEVNAIELRDASTMATEDRGTARDRQDMKELGKEQVLRVCFIPVPNLEVILE